MCNLDNCCCCCGSSYGCNKEGICLACGYNFFPEPEEDTVTKKMTTIEKIKHDYLKQMADNAIEGFVENGGYTLHNSTEQFYLNDLLESEDVDLDLDLVIKEEGISFDKTVVLVEELKSEGLYDQAIIDLLKKRGEYDDFLEKIDTDNQLEDTLKDDTDYDDVIDKLVEGRIYAIDQNVEDPSVNKFIEMVENGVKGHLEDYEDIYHCFNFNQDIIFDKIFDFSEMKKIGYKSNQTAHCLSRSDMNYVDYTLYEDKNGEQIVVLNQYENNGHGSLSRADSISDLDWDDIPE